ncbi:MAG: type II toxin-antitoxin system VapB family antitoxin [Chloroflexi bacterium]|nr:type II toxin-antitoxin system VapB family antitoxin [Chloroflexota bacterium]
MSLNIKNEETCRLAGELAQLTNDTMTGAITVALRERLERERHQRSAEERLRKIRAVAERYAALFPDSGPPIDHAELLYDERGLPK